MKILFTGGGSGGHFYPLIAIAQELNALVVERKIIAPKYYYMSDTPYDEKVLFEYDIKYLHASAGKLRRYFSFLNFSDIFKTIIGSLSAIWQLFFLYPDVVVGKGGHASFPAILAARVLGIPVVIHESDSKPGRVNKFAGGFAKKIGIAYPDAANYFPKGRTALVGIPIRTELRKGVKEGARAYLDIEDTLPVILIVGGSQGSERINDVVIDILPKLLEKYAVIHQVGTVNVSEINERISVVLKNNPLKERYKLFGFLSSSAIAMSAGISSIVVSRGGSTFIFEIAGWGLPSIIIPIPEEISHDQRKNAFNYVRTGAATLLEEANLTPHILLAEIERIVDNQDVSRVMREHATAFSTPDAAKKMAEVVLEIGLSHER